MTLSDDDFRDFAALAAMINISKQIDWQYAIDPALAKHVASQAFDLADAMLEESQRRRAAGMSNYPERPDSCDDPSDPHNWSIHTMHLRPSAVRQMENLGIRTIGDLVDRFNLSLKDK